MVSKGHLPPYGLEKPPLDVAFESCLQRPYKGAFSRPYLEGAFQGHIEAVSQDHMKVAFKGI